MRSFSISFLIMALLSGGCGRDNQGEVQDTLEVTPTTELATTSTGPAMTSTTVRPITIMAIGDSITQGSLGWDTYRCYLDRMLRDAGVPFDFVGGLSDPFSGQPYGCPTEFDMDHEGRWGWRADQVGVVVTASVESLQPDIALIHLGSNDVLQGQENSETVADLEGLITGLQAVSPDITILVAQIIPCILPECATNVPALNAEIASMSELSTAESTVIIVNMETGFRLDDLRDGIHPDDEGDQLIASRWMQAMEENGLI